MSLTSDNRNVNTRIYFGIQEVAYCVCATFKKHLKLCWNLFYIRVSCHNGKQPYGNSFDIVKELLMALL